MSNSFAPIQYHHNQQLDHFNNAVAPVPYHHDAYPPPPEVPTPPSARPKSSRGKQQPPKGVPAEDDPAYYGIQSSSHAPLPPSSRSHAFYQPPPASAAAPPHSASMRRSRRATASDWYDQEPSAGLMDRRMPGGYYNGPPTADPAAIHHHPPPSSARPHPNGYYGDGPEPPAPYADPRRAPLTSRRPPSPDDWPPGTAATAAPPRPQTAAGVRDPYNARSPPSDRGDDYYAPPSRGPPQPHVHGPSDGPQRHTSTRRPPTAPPPADRGWPSQPPAHSYSNPIPEMDHLAIDRRALPGRNPASAPPSQSAWPPHRPDPMDDYSRFPPTHAATAKDRRRQSVHVPSREPGFMSMGGGDMSPPDYRSPTDMNRGANGRDSMPPPRHSPYHRQMPSDPLYGGGADSDALYAPSTRGGPGKAPGRLHAPPRGKPPGGEWDNNDSVGSESHQAPDDRGSMVNHPFMKLKDPLVSALWKQFWGWKARIGPGASRVPLKHAYLCCPFLKTNPARYRDCAGSVLTSAKRLKKHIVHHHRVDIYCPVCMASDFKTEEERNEHTRQQACAPRLYAKPGGVTDDQLRQISRRLRSAEPLEEQWYQVFDIIFPKYSPQPASPYLNDEFAQDVQIFDSCFEQVGLGVIDDELRRHFGSADGRDASMFQKLLREECLRRLFDHWMRSNSPPSAAIPASVESPWSSLSPGSGAAHSYGQRTPSSAESFWSSADNHYAYDSHHHGPPYNGGAGGGHHAGHGPGGHHPAHPPPGSRRPPPPAAAHHGPGKDPWDTARTPGNLPRGGAFIHSGGAEDDYAHMGHDVAPPMYDYYGKR